jgi:DNA-binding response OmpR family regulator
MKHTVLVVDDEIGALTLIALMLERAGFSVLKARDASVALMILDQQTPDIVILDVMMPGIDGIELCRQIRKRELTATTPILILSARGDGESVMKGMAAGANAYLAKPIMNNNLVEKTREMLAQHGEA